MTVNFKNAQSVKAISLLGKIGIFGGDSDPRVIDTESYPVGSVYFQTDGTAWKRSGADASAWVKLVAEDMMLLNLGLALGVDGWAHALQMAGHRSQELMVRDAQVIELLQQILQAQQTTNDQLSLITGEQNYIGER
ncbi:MAG: hypothetical protein HQL74_12575 [Magnetococcales bacterium]|nr:hypothetical protein [Magnetococcales bacterium]